MSQRIRRRRKSQGRRSGRATDPGEAVEAARPAPRTGLPAVDVKELTDGLNTKVRGLAIREWGLDGSGVGIIESDRQRLTQAVIQLAQKRRAAHEPIATGSGSDPRSPTARPVFA